MGNELHFQLEMAKSNVYTLKILQEDKELYLHSKYNPEKEAINWANNFYEPGRFFILIGNGLGYYSKALLAQMGDEDYLLIVEPSKKIFKLAANAIDFKFIEDKRVYFAFSEEGEELQNICRLLMKRKLFINTKMAIASNYNKVFSADKIVDKLRNAILSYTSEIITKSFFAKEWQENYLRNIECAIRSCPVTQFENRFNVPAVIVSAGPSLTQELENLKKIYNKALIICAGSAAPVLMKNDITPHLIVSIDGGIPNYLHFKDINYDSIPLFYSPTIHHEILKTHLGAKVIFQWDGVAIADWYNETIGLKTGIIKVGPSVANSALDIAYKMTSGPICFVGQDLGYTGGYSHAEGNDHRKNLSDIKEHLPVKKIEANDGSELWSEYSYILMKEWFENYLEAYPEHIVYNAALKGARIQGTKVIDFGEFIDRFCISESNIKKEMDSILSEWNQSKKEVKKEEFGKHMLLCLEQLIGLTDKSLILSKKLLNKVRNEDFRDINKILNKMTALDEKIKALKDKDGLLYFIMQPINDKIEAWDQEEKDGSKKALQIAEKNYFFYRELHRASQEAKKILVNTSLLINQDKKS